MANFRPSPGEAVGIGWAVRHSALLDLVRDLGHVGTPRLGWRGHDSRTAASPSTARGGRGGGGGGAAASVHGYCCEGGRGCGLGLGCGCCGCRGCCAYCCARCARCACCCCCACCCACCACRCARCARCACCACCACGCGGGGGVIGARKRRHRTRWQGQCGRPGGCEVEAPLRGVVELEVLLVADLLLDLFRGGLQGSLQ